MKMKILYIADDGEQFDDEIDCEYHEWKLKHPDLNNVYLYDKDGKLLENLLLEETYINAEKIVINTDNAVKDLQELGVYTGYRCYEDITRKGVWLFNKSKGTYVLDSDSVGVL